MTSDLKLMDQDQPNVLRTGKGFKRPIRPKIPLLVMNWGRVVLEEAHHIRNADTSQAKATYQLLGAKRIAVTGTPFQNEYSDIRSIFTFLRLMPWADRSKLFWSILFTSHKREHEDAKSKAEGLTKRNPAGSLSPPGLQNISKPREPGERSFTIQGVSPVTLRKDHTGPGGTAEDAARNLLLEEIGILSQCRLL